ncbi:MAG: DUF192 domain-containing protein [Undibacterium sp.]
MNTNWFTKERNILLLVTIMLGIAAVVFSHAQRAFDLDRPERFPTIVWTGFRWWSLDIAATSEARTLGLGERGSYPENHGMLFLFDRPDRYGFWMKGMRFPIDIIFLSRGRVISIERSFQPSDRRIVTPPEPVDQVLEVNAGEADHLSPGDQVWYWRSF